MWTERVFVFWKCIRINGDFSRQKNWFKPPSTFPSDRSNAVPLLQFFFVCASVVS